jgi:hypothetical protein
MSHAEKILVSGGRGGSGVKRQAPIAEAYQESADARGTALLKVVLLEVSLSASSGSGAIKLLTYPRGMRPSWHVSWLRTLY